VDPLSGYNPVMEVEHYIDGQHNGGVYNSFNHNTYGYCYQSPIRYIDPNGKQVDVITETKGTGHTFVSIGNGTNRTVYNYGRYNGGTWYTGGTSGSGILLKFEGKEAANYIRTELYRMEAKVFRIKNADENAVRKFFEDKYNQGNKIDSDSKDINTFGREIDKYFILSNNCTTLSIKGIKAGGSDVFDGDGFIIPKSLQNFLEKSDNPNITNITSYYKNIYANSNNNEALGSSTGSAGTTSGSGASSVGSSSNNLSTGRGYSSGLSLGFSSN
jgi:hypothetical protein